MKSAELTTTSYALLTLLSLRDWSTYELTKQMQRSYHWFWPRAESKLYEEPKKLVALGLAHAEPGSKGRGKGTIYSITEAGREALREWLASPGSPAPRLEFEGLVRIFAADQGTRDNLLGTLRSIADEMERWQAFGAALGMEVNRTGGPFPDRLHINALVHHFLWGYSEAIRTWALWAQGEVTRWEDMSEAERREAALAIFRIPSEALAERAGRLPDQSSREKTGGAEEIEKGDGEPA